MGKKAQHSSLAQQITVTLCGVGIAIVLGILGVLWAQSVFSFEETPPNPDRVERMTKPTTDVPDDFQLATFGNGCFWCTEAVFQQLNGVHSAIPGYTGGNVKNPTYRQVCAETTGHAEVVQIKFDPKVIRYSELLEVFWKTHDPTTLNRQGADVGTQYRSAIFYHSAEQKAEAKHYRKKLDDSGAFDAPIVTEITEFSVFYPAEDDHKDYYLNHPNAGYCAAVIRPKLDKFEKAFAEKLKPAKP